MGSWENLIQIEIFAVTIGFDSITPKTDTYLKLGGKLGGHFCDRTNVTDRNKLSI